MVLHGLAFGKHEEGWCLGCVGGRVLGGFLAEGGCGFGCRQRHLLSLLCVGKRQTAEDVGPLEAKSVVLMSSLSITPSGCGREACVSQISLRRVGT